MKRLLFALSLLNIFVSCTTNKEVDLIVFNAKIYTVDSLFTNKEAFAVKNGIFIDIGESTDILNRYKAKETIDADGKAVYPGFYDAHAHSFMLADFFQEVDLTGSTSMDEIVQKLQKYKSKNPTKKWIIGRGWDQNLFDEKVYPNRDSLDKYFPNTPIFLSRVDYHAALVNGKALEIAYIDSAQVIEGGLLLTDSLGIPNGILIDKAMELVQKHIPSSPEDQALKHLIQAQDSLFSVGLTSIVDAGLSNEELELLKQFYLYDSLKIRDYAMIFAEPHNIDSYLREGVYETERFTIKSIKMMADGALGSRGASLLTDYSDSPSKGFLLHSPEEFDGAIRRIAQSPYQLSIHAIGDSANRLILDLYGKHLTENKKRRWRIEHAQVVAPEDFAKFRKYQIIPSIQPTHATSDMYWVEERLGPERAKGAYAFKDLLKMYGKVALGSDFPVEHFNPLYGFHAAIARVDKNNLPEGGFQLQNALTREEALRGMTIWAAYACFQEKKRGSIEKGKDADFVILADDIMTADVDKLRNIKTLRTVIAGETVYKAQ